MSDENVGVPPVGPPPVPTPVVLGKGTYLIEAESTLVAGGETISFASGTLTVS